MIIQVVLCSVPQYELQLGVARRSMWFGPRDWPVEITGGNRARRTLRRRMRRSMIDRNTPSILHPCFFSNPIHPCGAKPHQHPVLSISADKLLASREGVLKHGSLSHLPATIDGPKCRPHHGASGVLGHEWLPPSPRCLVFGHCQGVAR